MPVAPLKELVDEALAKGYAVPAINIVDELSLRAVVDAAVELRSPLIVQTSVKTVKSVGRDVLKAMFDATVAPEPVPVALHLDHCPDREVISSCLAAGWNSVLFDASALPVEENQRQTVEVVAEARKYGAHVEGEIEGITGVEDGVGSDTESERQSLAVATRFVETTGVDVFAPAIGNAHGIYRSTPELHSQRITDLVAATGIPMALHGGSGLTPEQFRDLIGRGCAKVNISTALKVAYMKSSLEHLEEARAKDKWDPPTLFRNIHAAVKAMTVEYIEIFGSGDRA
ncbi:fructose-bisphosphate aldolase class II [Kribbella rubisoli]|uniref:Fructose-bisphosphate aldolase class II n=1 Tax=Kribbella rubisoli TaxID=3075929 RepID=A0A4Q7WKI3_9ACTN|nr:class II fructose-bisphosphate aldolase [Kribbella rubisoli]RZU10223.1 fructose-bisphosphate aldolase class II [Kribbella rubisoli]